MQVTLHTLKDVLPTQVLVFVLAKGESITRHIFWKKVRVKDQSYLSLFAKKEFTAEEKECKVAILPSGKKALLIGKGEEKKWNYRKMFLLCRQIMQTAKEAKIGCYVLAISDVVSTVTSETVEQIVAQSLIADYDFHIYKKRPQDGWPQVEELSLVVDAVTPELKKAAVMGKIIGEQVNGARDLANIPGGDMTPTLLAEKAREIGEKFGGLVTVLGKKQMEAEGMGAVLGVAKGSVEEPKFIIMEYSGGEQNDKTTVLVGKGVTFDTGGVNLKPDKAMLGMHMDMSGAAAVIHVFAALARMKVKKNIVALIPAVENMPGGSGYRPGDVLKSLSGMTIEIGHTDAEGRVILADALTYAKRFNPEKVFDVATLTGAAMAALGARASAVFSKNQKLIAQLKDAGEASGDFVWEMPLWDEYEEEIKGTVGDVQNVGKFSGKGGAITAAMFLYQFAKKYTWAHIDIAPTMESIEGQYLAKGATGAGCALLIQLLK